MAKINLKRRQSKYWREHVPCIFNRVCQNAHGEAALAVEFVNRIYPG